MLSKYKFTSDYFWIGRSFRFDCKKRYHNEKFHFSLNLCEIRKNCEGKNCSFQKYLQFFSYANMSPMDIK